MGHPNANIWVSARTHMADVSIIGGYATPMTDFRPDAQFYELVFVAAKRALESVGLHRGDIGFVALAGYDYVDGRTISNMYTSMAAGGFLKDESRVSDDSLLALAYAYMKIKSGEVDTALVASYAAQESSLVPLSNVVFDPYYYRPVAQTYLAGLALQASAYISTAKLHERYDEVAAQILSFERDAASRNPRAHIREPLEPAAARSKEFVVWPLREGMYPPATRGAVALVLAESGYAERIGVDPAVRVESVAWFTDNYYLGGKRLGVLAPLMKAAREAYVEAGIADPREVDLFMISDVTPFHYLMELEALGLSAVGGGVGLLERGEVGPEGRRGHVVNPDGGSMCTDPYPASGLLKTYEAYLQLLGRAGEVQAKKGVGRALVHGFSYISGASAQTHAVAILSR